MPIVVLTPDGKCAQWASFPGLAVAASILDINFDGNMDILVVGAMQSVIGTSSGSAFNMQYGGSSGAAGSFSPAPFVDMQVNGLEAYGNNGGARRGAGLGVLFWGAGRGVLWVHMGPQQVPTHLWTLQWTAWRC